MVPITRPIRLILLFAISLYLGLYNDHLALWQKGYSVPIREFPYHISLYPSSDRSLLEEGINITSEKDLSTLLEDYFS